ncbi:UDP-glucose/GDP-mannose dehydrogenase family protein [Candidatus Woesearchaeota archaeon]|nr:UDP-glucose/GDP-mannose dehydrogenase family protein [Candidatus Woesearchaeota archaeon]
MKIAVIGTGYVGLVLGTCLAELGNEVICVDINSEKIKNLNKGIIPIYEPGLKELVKRNLREKRIFFTTKTKKAVEDSLVIFIAVNTPQSESGAADLSAIKTVAASIGEYLNDYKIIVNKSTVPIGTAGLVKKIIKENLKNKIEFDVVSNPEFLKEGVAIRDFMVPDRIVVGTDSEKAKEIMLKIYKTIARTERPIVVTTPESAELIKYASNAMLATRISFINELSHLCEKTGADIKEVARGMGLDKRIGPRFLQAGIGYGGSCFPKDIRALVSMLKKKSCTSKILEAVDEVNELQKHSLIPKIKNIFPNLKDKKIAIWGLAFKPKTDDIREAPSVLIVKKLLEEGAQIKAFDPEAMSNMKTIYPDITYAENPYDCLIDANALIILTEWNEFRELDKEKTKSLMKEPTIIDGRNIYNPDEMKKAGFNYMGVGR